MANIEIRQETPTAFYIKVHDTDNVAIIVNDNGLKAGTRFPDGLELIEHIPQGHKVALLDIPANGEIIRYGEVIGYAVRAIPRGSWIDESMVVLPEAPRYTRCHWQPKSRHPYRHWKDTPLRAIAMPMAAWALKTCSASPPASTVWQAWWTM